MKDEQRIAAATLRRGDAVRGAGWTPSGSYGGFVGTLSAAELPKFRVTTATGQQWLVDISERAWHPGGYRQWISAAPDEQP